MFGIGPMEIVVVLIVALLFVGPQKLPELAKQLGRFFVQAKRMTSDVRSSIDGYMKEAESEIIAEERKKIKELIEAEIKDVEPMEEKLDEENHMHPDHDGHHEKDDYFETAEDDPAYQSPVHEEPEKDGVWSHHSEEDDPAKKS